MTFSSIPAGTKVIIVSFIGVSTTGASVTIGVQLGDSGGLESTGYVGMSVRMRDLDGTPAIGATALSDRFIVAGSLVAANNYSGSLWLALEDSSDFTWSAHGNLGGNAAADSQGGWHSVGGYKTLSAELTQLAVLTSGTFDAGAVNIAYIG